MADHSFTVGSEVAVISRHTGVRGPYKVRHIHARTGNVMLDGADGQFDGRGGRRRSTDRWPASDRIEPWSNAHADAIARQNALGAISVIPWHKLPTNILREVVEKATLNMPREGKSS